MPPCQTPGPFSSASPCCDLLLDSSPLLPCSQLVSTCPAKAVPRHLSPAFAAIIDPLQGLSPCCLGVFDTFLTSWHSRPKPLPMPPPSAGGHHPDGSGHLRVPRIPQAAPPPPRGRKPRDSWAPGAHNPPAVRRRHRKGVLVRVHSNRRDFVVRGLFWPFRGTGRPTPIVKLVM